MKDISRVKIAIVALFAVVATTFFVLAATTAEVAAAGDPASPRSLYMNNCARCHGADGRAQTRLGRKLDADDITGGVGTGKTIRLVTNGKGDMPSFKRKLTSAQIAQIAGYVRGL